MKRIVNRCCSMFETNEDVEIGPTVESEKNVMLEPIHDVIGDWMSDRLDCCI